MLSISHATTGAVLAANISNPYLAIPLILASHYLEDAVPHWDAGTGLSSGRKTRQQAIKHGLIDLALAGIMVMFFYPHLRFEILDLSFWHSAPVWGAFIGLLPDFLEAPRNFLHYEPAWLKPINHFHAQFHHSIPSMIDGLSPQFLLLVVLWLLH